MTRSEIAIIKEAFHAAARAAVNAALKKRLVVNIYEGCEVCGETKGVEAHHYKGYNIAYWLEVRWLCKKHHLVAEKVRQECDCLVCSLQPENF